MASCSAWFKQPATRAFISPPPLGEVHFQQHGLLAERGVVLQLHQALLFAVPVSNCHAVSGGIKAAFHTVISPLRLPLRFCLSASAATISCSSSAKSSACLSVLMLPESELPFFQQLRGESEMVIKPSSFTVNSPSKVRTGMPPASAGAAAVEQIDRAFQRQAFCECRHHGGVKNQLGFGQASDKGLRVDAVALDLDMVDFSIQFFNKLGAAWFLH